LGFLKYLKLMAHIRIRSKEGHILYKGERLILTPPDTYGRLYERLTKIIGKGGAASALYMGSKESSKSVYRLMLKLFREEDIKSEETFGKTLEELMSISGYGKAEALKVDFEKPEVVIRVLGFITSSGVDKSEVPVCHVERGVLTGIIECITGKTCTGREVKCQAMGDEYCEFIIIGSEG